MDDLAHGVPFKDLGVKPGDWVRVASECATRGVEIQVPERNMTNIVVSWCHHVACENKDGVITAYHTGSCFGDSDMWVKVDK